MKLYCVAFIGQSPRFVLAPDQAGALETSVNWIKKTGGRVARIAPFLDRHIVAQVMRMGLLRLLIPNQAAIQLWSKFCQDQLSSMKRSISTIQETLKAL